MPAEQNQDSLPAKAYIDNRDCRRAPGTRAPVVVVARGRPGYVPLFTQITADELNEAQGVTEAQREALAAMAGLNTYQPTEVA